MTSGQVFRWFCKDQKINHLIHEMYHEIHPSFISFFDKDEPEKVKYVSFDEYVDRLVEYQGFQNVLRAFITSYRYKKGKKKSLEEYVKFTSYINNKFEPYIKKWIYFSGKNIIPNENIIKVGDEVFLNDYTFKGKIRITQIDLSLGHIVGISKGHIQHSIIANVCDENNKPIKMDYIIKRKKKVYYGANKG